MTPRPAATKRSPCSAETDYDLVLTDLHMEGGEGLAVLNEIRRHAPLTISVVLTGFASVESAISALQEGAYDYLVKPCDIESDETHDSPRRRSPSSHARRTEGAH